MEKKFKLYLGFLMVLLLMIPLVVAFGVTTPYWDTKPLTMSPGGTTDLELYLQNMVGEEDMTLTASIVEGEDIATLLDENLVYSLPFGTSATVHLRITLPEDILPGETRKVAVSFKQIVDSEGKMIHMGGAVKAYIPVEIIQTPSEAAAEEGGILSFSSTTVIIVVLLVIIVVGIIIAYLVRTRREDF